jgi:hypothetical protein
MEDAKKELILQKLDQLKENSDSYGIELSVPNGWLFYEDGDWFVVRYSHQRRPRVEGSRYEDKEEMLYFLKASPMELRLQEECGVAYDTPIWGHAQDQQVFDSEVDRCYWCTANSEETEITEWESVDDGDVHLCPSCETIWDDQDELVKTV